MKKKLVIILSIIVLLVVGVISLYFIFNDEAKDSDSKRFSLEYTKVTDDNVFVYRDIDEIIKIMKNGTGVVYLGFPECKWCQAYVVYLNEVAKETGLEEIYYFNILEDRKNNTEEYQEIISLLEGYLQYDDEGNSRVFVPNVSFHVKGEIIGNDCETSLDTHGFDDPEEYWTKEEVSTLKETLTAYMEKVVETKNLCSSCNG